MFIIVKIYFKSEKAFRHIEFYLSLTEGSKKRLGNGKFTLHYSSLYVDSLENKHSISLIFYRSRTTCAFRKWAIIFATSQLIYFWKHWFGAEIINYLYLKKIIVLRQSSKAGAKINNFYLKIK